MASDGLTKREPGKREIGGPLFSVLSFFGFKIK